MSETSEPKTKPKKKNPKVAKKNRIKSFSAQVNCKCKRNCATVIDVIEQKEIFDQYHGYSKWSEKTEFLRSIVKRESVKENLEPIVNLKSKDFFSTCYFPDASGEKKRVCLWFATKLLQVSRMIHSIVPAI